ncbi:ATP-binding cassette domain-containing protein [Arthrobacter sp. S13_S34]|nr:ATP-binding cassette domain-containing protein [Arthrobacter sp. S13_S34]
MGNTALTVSRATKRYSSSASPTLDGVDLILGKGEVLAVLGPSGSGKSTLLRAIAGLEPLDSGSIEFENPDERHSVVFQQAALFPWLTVRENIAAGGRYRRNSDRFSAEHVGELLVILGLDDRANSYPEELSGGQAQRAAVGRALAIRPDILLLDEPFSALDPAIRASLQQWLRELIDRLQLTALIVTHDVDEAMVLGDRIGFFGGPTGFSREWSTVNGSSAREEILDYYGDHTIEPAAATAW